MNCRVIDILTIAELYLIREEHMQRVFGMKLNGFNSLSCNKVALQDDVYFLKFWYCLKVDAELL